MEAGHSLHVGGRHKSTTIPIAQQGRRQDNFRDVDIADLSGGSPLFRRHVEKRLNHVHPTVASQPQIGVSVNMRHAQCALSFQDQCPPIIESLIVMLEKTSSYRSIPRQQTSIFEELAQSRFGPRSKVFLIR